jgi:hypothetical protein
VNFMLSLASSLQERVSRGMAWTMLALGIGADVLWGAACIQSIVYAGDRTSCTPPRTVSLSPVVGAEGKIGAVLRFAIGASRDRERG